MTGEDSHAGPDDADAAPSDDVPPSDHPNHARSGSADGKPAGGGARPQLPMALGALGVVYGDLGTSAIYALHTAFTGASQALAPTSVNVLGTLSLVFWTLILIVSIKYMVFVLRADNRGEGGMFALIALLHPSRGMRRPSRRSLVLLGLIGAAMLYAGVMITPAISILSAVEGLKVASPRMSHFVLPVTLVILVLLFAAQRFGSTRIGAVFGPVMALWFVAIAALGVYGIIGAPQVVSAVNPLYAVDFFEHNGVEGFLILFGVFLVTTGAEALYADIGQFGRRSIRWTWFVFVLPALLLNYFGQGAMMLRHPQASAQPFYHLIPSPLLFPLVVLATLATVIASQAAITGAFSMTHQAGRLGMVPPSRIVQTSEESPSQVYVPVVNWALMAAGIVLVVVFQTSTKLASTYGISISTTMVVTTILAFVVARERGHWRLWPALLLLAGFLAVDLTYFASNVIRIPHGGWFPIAVAAVLFTTMATWRRGGELLGRRADKDAKTMGELLGEIEHGDVARVQGTAVFVTSRLADTPPSLTHHIRRSHALQRQVVLLTVRSENVPRTTDHERRDIDTLGGGFFRIVLRYGYMQQVNVPSELAACKAEGIHIDLKAATYYVEHESLLGGPGRAGGMLAWRDRLFGFLMRNSLDVTTHYQIPSRQVVDMGLRVRI